MADKTLSKQMFINGRVSYVNVFKPRPPPKGQPGEAKYGLAVLIPKSDKQQCKAIEATILEVAKDAFGPNAAKLIQGGKIGSIWRDGDVEEDRQGYEGHMFFNTTAVRKPGLVDKNRQPIDDPEQFYSGCFAQVSVTFFAYKTPKSGVSAGLNNIRKIKDGDRLDGRKAAEAEEWPEVSGEDEEQPADASDLI